MSPCETAACRDARHTVQRQLDGDLMDAVVRQALERHLDDCPTCLEYRRDLEEVQETLRAVPALAMPDEALDEVFQRTSRAPDRLGSRFERWGLEWRAAAAALVLGIGIWGLWPQGGAGFSDEELQQAALEARLALKLTARTLNGAEETAVRAVLAGEVSPALDRLPIRFPESRGSGGGQPTRTKG